MSGRLAALGYGVAVPVEGHDFWRISTGMAQTPEGARAAASTIEGGVAVTLVRLDDLQEACAALARVEAVAARWRAAWRDGELPASTTPLVADLGYALNGTAFAAADPPTPEQVRDGLSRGEVTW